MMKKQMIQVVVVMLFVLTFVGAAPVRIMPLGDSITYDNNHEDEENPRPEGDRAAYRGYLWYSLENAGYEADFVGSESAGYDITPSFDPDNEGHPGWKCSDLSSKTYGYMIQNPADIVLLHIGTNDHGTSVSGVGDILDQIDRYERDTGQPVKVFVAMIIDRRDHDPLIEDFNKNLTEFIGTRIRNDDNLTLINMYTGAGLNRDDYEDNTHPNWRGYKKMAQVWYDALMGPETPGLYAFPYTLVSGAYIEDIDFNDAAKIVIFTTSIPNNGITF